MPRCCGAMATDSALPGFRWGFAGVSLGFQKRPDILLRPATSCNIKLAGRRFVIACMFLILLCILSKNACGTTFFRTFVI